MSELDVEKLKHIAARINEAEHEDPDVWLSLLEDFAEYVPAIIAALQDRERLVTTLRELLEEAEDIPCHGRGVSTSA